MTGSMCEKEEVRKKRHFSLGKRSEFDSFQWLENFNY